VLKLPPFDKLGTPIELLKAFGNKEDYHKAVRILEDSIYQDDAS
jgi:type I restriction enzyme R subunit